ncbi:restriction endonuclease [Streptomyces sp. NPDC058642]|uniref:restriction endonuclease n=1 Tax=Streptomyces sp. NPDC058642 TaxID=3346572 RepID=UPI00364D0731
MTSCRPPSPDAVMAVLLPAQAWVSDQPWAAKMRTQVADHWDTLLVIYGAGALTQISRNVESVIVFLRARAQARPILKLFQVPRPRTDETAVVKDFERLLVRQGGRGEHGYVLRETPSPEQGLYFDRFDPLILQRREDLAGFGAVDALGDLFTFHLAPLNEAELRKRKVRTLPKDPAGVRVIRPRDIGRDGTIAPPSEETLWATIPAERQLAAGDLVIRRLIAPVTVPPHGFFTAEIGEEDLPAAASEQVVVLRPIKPLSRPQARLITMFLRTPLALTLAGPRLTTTTMQALSTLPVPQPDEALTKALDELTVAKQQFKRWEQQADSVIESVFLEKTAAQARARVIDSGRALRLRAEAASLLDDLGHSVRTRFPYPIAYRWRETEARISAGDALAAYAAILDAAEQLLCYIAQLVLALTHAQNITLGAVTAIRDKLASGRSGPGFGDWANVLNEAATSKQLNHLPPAHPLNDIRTLLAHQDAEKARQALSERRNDKAHLRRVDPIDLPHAIEVAFADLTHLVERARFLADLPLLEITDVRWDAFARSARVEYRELAGDHPVVPTRTMTSPSNDLEKGSLYLRDTDGALHLLRPFLIGRDCPTCRTWSTFHADRVPKGAVVFKSLEHGHTLDDTSADTRWLLGQIGLV